MLLQQNWTVGVDTVGIKEVSEKKKQNKRISKIKIRAREGNWEEGEEWSRAYKHKRHGNT